MENILPTIRGWWDKLKAAWGKATPTQRKFAGLGGAIVAAGALIGGQLIQAVVTALIANTLLWAMIKESAFMMEVMSRWGNAIDYIITFVGMFFSGAGGITMLMTGVVVGAFFTIFRIIICSEYKSKAEQAEAPVGAEPCPA